MAYENYILLMSLLLKIKVVPLVPAALLLLLGIHSVLAGGDLNGMKSLCQLDVLVCGISGSRQKGYSSSFMIWNILVGTFFPNVDT